MVTCLGWVGLFISCRCYHLAEFGVGRKLVLCGGGVLLGGVGLYDL